MPQQYSRKQKVEEKKNIRKIVLFSFITIFLIVVLIVFGIPLIIRYTGFISSLSNSNTPFARHDTTAPTQPRLDLTSESTNRPKIDINGSSEPGSTVIIRKNSEEFEVLTNREGRFSTSVTLSDGDNIIRAKARDAAGNESYFTNEINVKFDKTEPELELIKPENQAQFYGPTQRQVTIEGKTESNAKVTINERIVILDGNGHFSHQYNLAEGNNTFKVKVEDEAGNATEREVTVVFTL